MNLAEGSTLFLIVVAVFLIAVAYALSTRTGSAINQRPTDSRGGAPGATGPSRLGHQDEEGGAVDDRPA